jgi:hypothetical protein
VLIVDSPPFQAQDEKRLPFDADDEAPERNIGTEPPP